LPDQVVALFGLGPLAVGTLAGSVREVKVRVPRGLPDPNKDAPWLRDNPPTLARWELGRRLFFDRGLLGDNQSCAGCHMPENGFADHSRHDGLGTPTLLNAAYNAYQFRDGRVRRLEEVFAQSLEDEREGQGEGGLRHVWGGVVRRLREDVGYQRQFLAAFGCLPSQDAVGRALATYLRTLLCGDSLHDRALAARAARKGDQLAEADYEKALDDAALKALGRDGKPKAEVAAELLHGYEVFHNLKKVKVLVGEGEGQGRPGTANCVLCHPPPLYTDNGFHNLGVGRPHEPAGNAGRFGTLPIGLKDEAALGAFKTPTLRSLGRTAPYLHTGELATLEAVVRYHARGGEWGGPAQRPLLDPLMRVGLVNRRWLGLSDADVGALVLFLRALDGALPDEEMRRPPR
jgi:cytochrome c peroxidase